MNQILCLAIICLLVVSIIPFAISASASSNSLNIFPPGAKPYGLSYPELAKNWWTWVYEIPANDNPMNDPTGEKCSIGQPKNSSVFYLSINNGGSSERTCKVPAGKGLVIPVMQAAYSEAELPGESDQGLAEAAKKDQDSVNSLYLKIDDKEYKYENLTKYRTHTEPFTVNIPPKATFGIETEGPSKAVADGYYIITEPLATGNHTIHFKSSLGCYEVDCTSPVSFAQDIKYNIIAE